ncbi:hypothetical protein BDZ89DRAFT_1237514 [Hymenopellis radicata]|nr:hypothetical protein BDZ89DRAFT_1237514 [Hymenopellis radicata]
MKKQTSSRQRDLPRKRQIKLNSRQTRYQPTVQHNRREAESNNITQATAYKAIKIANARTARTRGSKSYKKQMERPRTAVNLDKARFAAKDMSERIPSNKLIWKGTQHQDFSKQNKPGYEHWTKCEECGSTETMEHILFECTAPGQEEVWELVRNFWKQKTTELTNINFPNLLALALANPKNSREETVRGDARIHRIVVSEAAHLIWKLRNERVIQEEGHSRATKTEIQNKFLYALNDSLQLDLAALRRKKNSKKPAKSQRNSTLSISMPIQLVRR